MDILRLAGLVVAGIFTFAVQQPCEVSSPRTQTPEFSQPDTQPTANQLDRVNEIQQYDQWRSETRRMITENSDRIDRLETRAVVGGSTQDAELLNFLRDCNQRINAIKTDLESTAESKPQSLPTKLIPTAPDQAIPATSQSFYGPAFSPPVFNPMPLPTYSVPPAPFYSKTKTIVNPVYRMQTPIRSTINQPFLNRGLFRQQPQSTCRQNSDGSWTCPQR